MNVSHLKDFVLEKVLGDNPENRSLALLGHWKNEIEQPGKIILVLEKTSFSKDDADQFAHHIDSLLMLTDNDVFKSFLVTSNRAEVNHIRVNFMYPADQQHIRKYSRFEAIVVEESPEMYEKVSKLHIKNQNGNNLKWIYNILDGTAEVEGRLHSDLNSNMNGFVLLPDFKWDQKNKDKLYCLAIVNRRDIMTIRDLTEEHLPLLLHMKSTIPEAILKHFNVSPKNIRMFVHYQPSYYHFHIHVIHTNMFIGGFQASRAHLLQDVIENIQLTPRYYQLRTLTYELPSDDPLIEKYNTFNAD